MLKLSIEARARQRLDDPSFKVTAKKASSCSIKLKDERA